MTRKNWWMSKTLWVSVITFVLGALPLWQKDLAELVSQNPWMGRRS